MHILEVSVEGNSTLYRHLLPLLVLTADDIPVPQGSRWDGINIGFTQPLTPYIPVVSRLRLT